MNSMQYYEKILIIGSLETNTILGVVDCRLNFKLLFSENNLMSANWRLNYF